jgi:hypothetical protein
MKPKEKAKELVSKMYIEYKPSENDASGVYVFYMNLEIAKRCALIAVDEILSNDGWSSSIEEWNTFKNYFEQVKQEIQAL